MTTKTIITVALAILMTFLPNVVHADHPAWVAQQHKEQLARIAEERQKKNERADQEQAAQQAEERQKSADRANIAMLSEVLVIQQNRVELISYLQCSQIAERDEWRAVIAKEKKVGKSVGYVNMATLHEAGEAIVELDEQIAFVVTTAKAAKMKLISCNSPVIQNVEQALSTFGNLVRDDLRIATHDKNLAVNALTTLADEEDLTVAEANLRKVLKAEFSAFCEKIAGDFRASVQP